MSLKKKTSYAIVTCIFNGNSYVGGANALAWSAKQTQTQADLICLVTKDVPQQELKHFDKIIVVNPIYVSQIPECSSKFRSLYGIMSGQICTKFQALCLTEYVKILLLDADMLFLKNCDDLFELSTPAGCFSHQFSQRFVRHPDYPRSVKQTLQRSEHKLHDYPELKHGDLVAADYICNVLSSIRRAYGAQGGLYLLTPNTEDADLLKKNLTEILFSFPTPIVSGIDELCITWFYASMKKNDWTHIDMSYNVISLHLYPVFKEKTKIIHFLRYKPWRESLEYLEKHYPDQVITHKLYLKYGVPPPSL